MRFTSPGLLCTLILSAFAVAAENSPYAGMEHGEIKALTADEQATLIEGKGMGFAKAAELNGYPGPAHVLELSTQLELTAKQIGQTRAPFGRMQSQARAGRGACRRRRARRR